MAPGHEPLYSSARPDELRFHAPVWKVPYPAGHTLTLRDTPGAVAEVDALDEATNQDMSLHKTMHQLW